MSSARYTFGDMIKAYLVEIGESGGQKFGGRYLEYLGFQENEKKYISSVNFLKMNSTNEISNEFPMNFISDVKSQQKLPSKLVKITKKKKKGKSKRERKKKAGRDAWLSQTWKTCWKTKEKT